MNINGTVLASRCYFSQMLNISTTKRRSFPVDLSGKFSFLKPPTPLLTSPTHEHTVQVHQHNLINSNTAIWVAFESKLMEEKPPKAKLNLLLIDSITHQPLHGDPPLGEVVPKVNYPMLTHLFVLLTK